MCCYMPTDNGSAVTQTVSHWPFVLGAGVQFRGIPGGICGGKPGARRGFLHSSITHNHSFIYHRRYIILATDSDIK
jgi:hypothetical protein